MKPGLLLLALLASAAGFLGCAEVEEKSLDLKSPPAFLRVGDTTEALLAVKKSPDPRGRMQTQDPYTDFYLVSDDTAVARIHQERRVVGTGAGRTTITARDENDNQLSSPKYDLQVTCVICEPE